MRTVGVEEELLLVKSATGRAMSVAGRVLARAAASAAARAATTDDGGADPPPNGPGGLLERELQKQQIETDTRPHTDLDDLEKELRSWRRTAIEAALQVGADVAAVGLCPTPVVPRTADSQRYRTMVDRFGVLATDHLTCGCHVHVAVGSREEAVGVLDRMRVWLPLLLALSANSPYWQGKDTSYASYRYMVQTRWPSAGPTEVLGSARAYDELVARMIRTGAIMDTGMVYFDARASVRYPTVEVRIADVCLDPADAVLVAALVRALVDTTAAEWAAGEPPPEVPGLPAGLGAVGAAHRAGGAPGEQQRGEEQGQEPAQSSHGQTVRAAGAPPGDGGRSVTGPWPDRDPGGPCGPAVQLRGQRRQRAVSRVRMSRSASSTRTFRQPLLSRSAIMAGSFRARFSPRRSSVIGGLRASPRSRMSRNQKVWARGR
ncbi:carboxylate-amine ligase [Georgenia sp. SUBG003]|uniref:carboxylate-amine ligase n=1 Tax=Georgenia sp. SUBG003 TaxID=1497974 RepID=UPI003AB88AB2